MRSHPFAAVLIAATGCAHVQPPAAFLSDGDFAEALAQAREHTRDSIRAHGVRSASVGIVRDGRLVYSESFGAVDPFVDSRAAPAGALVDEHTPFRLASLTKLFTSVALLQLRDAGKLSLDDPVSKFIPELAQVRCPQVECPPIRLRHLITHTSGLPHDLAGFWKRKAPLTEAELLAALPGLPLEFTPGTDFAYSNLGVGLVGLVIARVSGESYRSYVREHVLAPLGMSDAVWDPSESRHPVAVGAAVGTPKGDKSVGEGLTNDWHNGVMDAAGSLYASLADMARFLVFELAAWPPREGEDTGPLARSSLRESQLVLGPTVQPGDQVGAGWFTGWQREGEVGPFTHHNGVLPGYWSQIVLVPHKRLGMIVLATEPSSEWHPDRDVLQPLVDVVPDIGLIVSPPIQKALSAVLRLEKDGIDPNRLAQIFSKNFLEKVPVEQLSRDLDNARRAFGTCRPEPHAVKSSELAARLDVPCDEKPWRLNLRLSSEEPGLIDGLSW